LIGSGRRALGEYNMLGLRGGEVWSEGRVFFTGVGIWKRSEVLKARKGDDHSFKGRSSSCVGWWLEQSSREGETAERSQGGGWVDPAERKIAYVSR